MCSYTGSCDGNKLDLKSKNRCVIGMMHGHPDGHLFLETSFQEIGEHLVRILTVGGRDFQIMCQSCDVSRGQDKHERVAQSGQSIIKPKREKLRIKEHSFVMHYLKR